MILMNGNYLILKTDPLEMKNVYNDPSYSSVRTDLHRRLADLMKKYKDSDALAKSFLPK